MKVMINGTWYDCERNDVIIECSSSELAMFATGHMDKLTWSSEAVKQAKNEKMKTKGLDIHLDAEIDEVIDELKKSYPSILGLGFGSK